jgi:hypothetical protein
VRTAQFLRFQSPPGGEGRLVQSHTAAVESCRASYPAFRAAFLVRLEDGDWLDIAFWDSSEDGDGKPWYPPLEARADFVSNLDGLLGDETGLLVSSFTDLSFRCD